MSKQQDGWISKAMAESRRKAERYLQDPTRLQGLSARVQHKMAHSRIPLVSVSESMQETLGNLSVMGRLARAYGRGHYRRIPWGVLGSIVAALIYFVTPTDFIPDFILAMGFVDDAAIIALVARNVATALEEFRAWERVHSEVRGAAPAATSAPADASGFEEIPISADQT